MFEAYPPLSPHDPRFPHDPHFGYFGSAPLPPWPVLSTVGQGPKGDGVVIKAKTDKDGREYLEFWSTDPNSAEPLWISPKFPERKDDGPDGDSLAAVKNRVAAIQMVVSYVNGLIEQFLYGRDTIRRTHSFTFRWNEKFVVPFNGFNLPGNNDVLRMRLGLYGKTAIALDGVVQQALDPNREDGGCIATPGSIVAYTSTHNQRWCIDQYLDKYFNGETEEGQGLTARDMAREASVIIPWSFPDGYIMYPLKSIHPSENLNASNRYNVYQGLSIWPSIWGTVCGRTYVPAECDYHDQGRYVGIPNFNPLNGYWTSPNGRRRAIMGARGIYSQKDYYSVDHDVSVVLPFALSGGTIEPGYEVIYHGILWSDNEDFQAAYWPPDSRIIDFRGQKNADHRTRNYHPYRRVPYELSRKAARVMIELAMGNGRGLWYSEENSGQPYKDPVYHEWILNPDQWRLDYNIANNGWVDATSSPNYYQASDRMVDWRPDHDINPMIRGSFFYSRDNSVMFRMFPTPRPKGLSNSDLLSVLSNSNIAHRESYYLKTMGADCSSSIALAYFSPIDTYGFNKSEDNQFWIPNLGGVQGWCGDLVAAAAPGVPLDLSKAKPGDIIMLNTIYNSDGTRKGDKIATATHAMMVVSTPDDPMISSADLLDLHYPVYDVPDWEDPNASANYDKKIKYFKKLTMDDVRNKVIVMHTSGSSGAVDMYKDANGNWQFVDQANRPSLPTMNPYLVANNDMEHYQQYRAYRFLCRWSYEEDSTQSHGDNKRANDPSTYIYDWVTNLIKMVENGEIDLYPTWDDSVAAAFDFGGTGDDYNDENSGDPNNESNEGEVTRSVQRDMLRGPAFMDDSTWFELADEEIEGDA